MTGADARLIALAAMFVACLPAFAFGQTPLLPIAGDVTVWLEPRETVVREGETIGITVVFAGGVQGTTLILPMGADASGLISFRISDISSGRQWIAARRDPRNFAADSGERLPAGGRRQLHYDTLEFRDSDKSAFAANLPAGKYRIVVVYDEGNAFRPENRGLRVLRSAPAAIVVTPR